jgi:uncharacterized protein (TIGR02147 family)
LKRLGKKLGLDLEQINHFILKNQDKRDQVIDLTTLDSDNFAILSHWYYGAIMQLPNIKGFIATADWAAKRLGLETNVVKNALEVLSRAGLIHIEKNGHWRRIVDGTISNIITDKSSEAAKTNYKQQLEVSQYTLEHVDIKNRDHTGFTMAFNKKEMKKAKEVIKKFRKEFFKEFSKSKSKDVVYNLQVSFFPMTDKEESQTSITTSLRIT